MESFLKTLLIILLVYFGLKFLFKLSLPYIKRYLARKIQNKMGAMFQNSGFNPVQKTPSESNKTKLSKKNRSKKEVVGEYVDYEEVE